MEYSSGSLFMTDNNLANTQNTASKEGESKTSTNNDIGECEHSDVTDTNSYLAASQKVWGIDLIWENITDYLSISDLKDLSLANKHFLEKVRNISRFRSSSGQIVAGQLKIHTFNLCRAVVKVNTLDDKILQERAAHIFQNTEYLELRNLCMSDETENSRLIKIVANCPKLKCLVFPKLIHLWYDWKPFFTNENVKSVFSKLKELQIGIDTKNVYYRDYQHVLFTFGTIVNGLHETFKYFPNLQMKLSKFSLTYSNEHFEEYKFFPELLLRSSEETLEELKITVDFEGFHALETMQFPKLKKLHLKMYTIDESSDWWCGTSRSSRTVLVGNILESFLLNHLSTLCEFLLESPHVYSLSPFCELFKSSKTIEVLQFSTANSFGNSLRSTNWDFLAAHPNFRDFKLSMQDADNDGDPRYYGSSSDTDTEEELEDENEEEQEVYIPEKNKSHYAPQYLDSFPSTIESIEFEHCIGNELVDIPTVIMTSSLERLKNLISLKLTGCKSFLNDDIVQFICQHLTKLRVFEGNFMKVTDFGISGVRGNGEPDSGISLANLKGLRKLTLSASCGGLDSITWTGLHKAIRFLELVALKVDGFNAHGGYKFKFTSILEEAEKNKPNFFILIDKTRNPSLEHIDINIHLPRTFDCKQFPRVKTFSRDSQSSWYANMLKGPTNNSETGSTNCFSRLFS